MQYAVEQCSRPIYNVVCAAVLTECCKLPTAISRSTAAAAGGPPQLHQAVRRVHHWPQGVHRDRAGHRRGAAGQVRNRQRAAVPATATVAAVSLQACGGWCAGWLCVCLPLSRPAHVLFCMWCVCSIGTRSVTSHGEGSLPISWTGAGGWVRFADFQLWSCGVVECGSGSETYCCCRLLLQGDREGQLHGDGCCTHHPADPARRAVPALAR